MVVKELPIFFSGHPGKAEFKKCLAHYGRTRRRGGAPDAHAGSQRRHGSGTPVHLYTPPAVVFESFVVEMAQGETHTCLEQQVHHKEEDCKKKEGSVW